MLRRPSQNWSSCENSAYFYKMLLTYIVTKFLCYISAEVDVGNLSLFVNEWQGTSRGWLNLI